MVILNVAEESFIDHTFLQYGILGAVALLLGYFAWIQYSRLAFKNDKLEEKVDKLQQEMIEILVEERDRMSKLITDNTQALVDLQRVITEYMIKQKQQ